MQSQGQKAHAQYHDIFERIEDRHRPKGERKLEDELPGGFDDGVREDDGATAVPIDASQNNGEDGNNAGKKRPSRIEKLKNALRLGRKHDGLPKPSAREAQEDAKNLEKPKGRNNIHDAGSGAIGQIGLANNF
ncbi:hypothetical protein DL93DRAFT_2073741 [Clavulina sp. PMI_390]|nr:hypothetical protein DL93DRAFT_2073741 [Clavulina sp. PMI_390]